MAAHSLRVGLALLGGGAACVLLFRRRRTFHAATSAPAPLDTARLVRLSTATAVTTTDAAHAVRTSGVCVVEGAVAPTALNELKSTISTLSPRQKANRRAHRWEHVHDPHQAPFFRLALDPLISRLVRQLLGPKTYLEKAGMIVSHPGAAAQRWHMDTPHLFASKAHLPPHSLTVFIALVAFTEENGPTEFRLGSHEKVNLVRPQQAVPATCEKGSLVVYDTRVMHRGGPNLSQEARPLVYLTFSRIWYRDTLNP